MAEGFFSGLHRNGLAWSGWLFTVAGTVFGLWTSQAYAWLGALCAVTGLFTLTALAYQRQRELSELEGRRVAQMGRLERDLQTARDQAERAERKLNELPANTLLRIEEVITANAFPQWVAWLVRHAEYVERMIRFAQASHRPMSLRTFVKQSGGLFAVARAEGAAVALLRDGDPFLLTHESARGLTTDSAQLVVHQRDEGEGLVWFRIEVFLGEEMPHLDALASTKDVAGLTGYSVRPLCSVERYTNLNLSSAAELIRRLADEIAGAAG